MKYTIRTISFVLVIVFAGLIAFGLVVSAVDTSESDHVADCFGTGCGPVEHVVMHSYIVSDYSRAPYSALYYSRQSDIDNTFVFPEIAIKSPPPKLSLV